MIRFFRRLHNYYYIFTALLTLALFYPLLWFYSRKQSRYPTLNKLRRVCCYISSTASGIFFNVTEQEPVDWSRTYIVCPNHTSNLDILAMCIAVKGNYHFMSKAELANTPFFKIFAKTVDIPVNRESKISSFKAFKKAAENLKQGQTLIIFPEGKIGDEYPPILEEFKSGPFRLAIELKIPILPITSLNTWHILHDSGFKRGSRPGICDIFIHKSIETAHLTINDADLLKDEVYNLINQKFMSADLPNAVTMKSVSVG
ncbi:1-acyl-sn-glycerol-3-phosphate acyltransferase [Mucilaginibacter gracilis]|uniref:1-acyl-sn-glycerol-3-phosphate acyltransferase n=1 Tax=Mucilaginibacter gracilis TaxID=423350 RepID=A0A495J642_9SPHI|nr:lysophospholipid acyltransferase family protein [Mucilaginibacter gracilis]RKR83888.1 1-acyl-sn-glycerol-3-phosphate acyltransferase [Mucilaginibacter gracilis]